MKLFLLVALFLLPVAAFGQTHDDHTGTSLLRECKAATSPGTTDSVNNLETGLCIGLVRGVMGTMQMWKVERYTVKEQMDMHGCIPHQVEESEAIRVVLKYLNDHPDRLHLDDTILIHTALLDEYPCK
jgi:hypothetical protein